MRFREPCGDIAAWTIVANAFDSAVAVRGLSHDGRAMLLRSRSAAHGLARRPTVTVAQPTPDNLIDLAGHRLAAEAR